MVTDSGPVQALPGSQTILKGASGSEMITSFELDVHFFPVTSTTSFLPGSFGYVPGVVSLTQIFPVFFF